MLMLLLESQSQPTLTLLIPSSKQLVLREILSAAFTGLQNNTKNIKFYKIDQTQPSHQGTVPSGYNVTIHIGISSELNISSMPFTTRCYMVSKPSNYHDALQAHMHPLHKLGNANTEAKLS